MNMKQEIRKELIELRKQRNQICREWSNTMKPLAAESRRIETAINCTNRQGIKACNRIDRRIAILQGRLA